MVYCLKSCNKVVTCPWCPPCLFTYDSRKTTEKPGNPYVKKGGDGDKNGWMPTTLSLFSDLRTSKKKRALLACDMTANPTQDLKSGLAKSHISIMSF